MIRLALQLGTMASLCSLIACGASPSSGDDEHANRGGNNDGSGGSAGLDARAGAGDKTSSGGSAAGESSNAGSSGARAGGGGANAGGGGARAGSGDANAGGGPSDSGNGGAMGGSSGSPTSGGAGGSGGKVEACAFASAEHFLWSGVAPGSEGATVVEVTTGQNTNPLVQDRMITGVTKPSVSVYLAPRPNGAAAVVIPGGGYRYVAFDREGVDIATWLNSIGVSAFVLKYRLPTDFPRSTWVALADAQRAQRLVRKSAAACGIDPTRIGVIGFSAGGHLASQLATRFSARPTPAADEIDAIDARPAFGVLMYPVISMDAAIAHAGSRTALLGASPTPADVALHSSELQVTSMTPATFIATSNRDATVKPENSVRFDTALAAAGVAKELHLYQDGGHGTGIRNASGDMASWPAQCAAWLSRGNFLSAAP